ncbi:MAG: GNAT family N-acetyltransferase, partial [Caldilineaceae bacterium]|nr:GNAT family N-acetyltransferase [Caldilineaceae bacterium]
DDDGALLAAGGTHIVNWELGVGAIGNMYTRPDSRGRGYAGVVLAAIVNTLRAGGVDNIVLNVDQRNEPARRIYEKYGFRIHCPYVEGIGVRRDA